MSRGEAPVIEPLDPNLVISLPEFEGPLDLLIHLIQKHELPILDLPIAFITERYLEYIDLMKSLDLDIASEYLVMAATLAYIKSKTLLPPDPNEEEEEDEGEEIDPRGELIRRLLEYQKYKLAAEELGSRGVVGRDVFYRGTPSPSPEGDAPLASIGLFSLLDAFRGVLDRAHERVAFRITTEGIGIQERMMQLTEQLRSRRRCTFTELFEGKTELYDLVITFMAILEMAKRRMLRIYQSEPIAPIHLELKISDADAEGPEAYDPDLEPEPYTSVGTRRVVHFDGGDEDDDDDLDLEEDYDDDDFEDDDDDDEEDDEEE